MLGEIIQSNIAFYYCYSEGFRFADDVC